MKKCELLSPAGNMEMLKYAILNGADAIYLAGNKFGARKYAQNFTNEEIIEAIKYAHLYNVKVYITVNTLIYENEIEDLLNYIEFIHNNGVDAILVQDFGMLNIIHEKFPNLELHASTQMHNNGLNYAKLLKKLGVKRIVLDREMSIDEIKNINIDIEKEVFVHGALCVSYSGLCLLSKRVLNRSGNRGECAGLCRLPYKLKSNNKTYDKKYYLCLKDLFTANHIDKILDANVDSLKIEGRLKSKEYVGYITKLYRKQIDKYYNKESINLTQEEIDNAKLLFNRGYTKGFILNETNDNMPNLESPNHIGLHLGYYKVINNKVEIKLDKDLYQKDTIRFKEDKKGMTINFLYDKNNKLINKQTKGNICFVDNFLNLKNKGEVRLVSSIKLNESINNLPKKVITINGSITIKKNKPITLTISDNINKVSISYNKPSIAINRPITKDNILKQLNKTNDTIYKFENINIKLDDNLFVNLKDINTLRREALNKLNEERCKTKKVIVKDIINKNIHVNQELEISIKIENKEQYNEIKDFATKIIVDNKLYDELKNDKKVIKLYEENSKVDTKEYMIRDYATLINKQKDDIIHAYYTLNVTNSNTIKALEQQGVNKIILSPELDIDKIKDITTNYLSNSMMIYLYGKLTLMTSKYKIANNNDILINNENTFIIKNNKKFTYLIDNKPLNNIYLIKEFQKLRIKKYYIEFYNETTDEIKEIMKTIDLQLK